MSPNPIRLDIDLDVDSGARRYRWRLVCEGEPDLVAPTNCATRREAVAQGEIALSRARARGTIRPPMGNTARASAGARPAPGAGQAPSAG